MMCALPVSQAQAAEAMLVIKDHKFIPEALEIPAGQKVKITIDNQDPTPEEFESHELNREKIIPGHSKGIVFVGPLEAGEYPFFGEFNMDTAQGKIIAK
jgi:hypothetical protein